MRKITKAFVLLFALGTLIQPAAFAQAGEVDLSVSTQVPGLSLEYPLNTLDNTYGSDDVLATVQFGGNAPLLISEKKGLTADEDSEQTVSLSRQSAPLPIISPADPLVTSTMSAIIISEPTATFILDSFPTHTFTTTPVPTKIPTKAATTTPTPQQTTSVASVTATIQVTGGGLNAETLFTMSNTHRISKGLPPFQKDARACELATARAPEIGAEIANGNMHAGMYGRNLPYWNTENIISMGSEESAFNWWINDGIHREAIEGNYTYSCVACTGNNCAQEFTNFQSK